MQSHTTLHLYKQNFRFSAAHFLIFDAHRAERLHGHNYQVEVELRGEQFNHQSGYYIEFKEIKKIIRDRLARWNETVLMPARNEEMKFATHGTTLEIIFRERRYAFPVSEVVLLPTNNTSVEHLSRILAEDLMGLLNAYGVQTIRVQVEETQGQAASCTLTRKSRVVDP
ncbi:MAG: 6-pyruvoyl tetrahydropterin synthase [Bdellovibrio sp.]|nr:MAG: 6-pyruvoyl tetrahydropterin synthase [Bdellovibrio sp.]